MRYSKSVQSLQKYQSRRPVSEPRDLDLSPDEDSPIWKSSRKLSTKPQATFATEVEENSQKPSESAPSLKFNKSIQLNSFSKRSPRYFKVMRKYAERWWATPTPLTWNQTLLNKPIQSEGLPEQTEEEVNAIVAAFEP